MARTSQCLLAMNRLSRPTGAVAIEFVVATMVFIPTVLGAIQLTFVQQAKLAAKYAAFAAARIGSVENLSPEKMLDAARLALAPTADDASYIDVAIESPTVEQFGDGREIEFDDQSLEPTVRERTRATIRVLYWYELRIPVAAQLFAAGLGARRLFDDLVDEPCGARQPPPSVDGRVYIPLTARYTIRMQSNAFRKHVEAAGC